MKYVRMEAAAGTSPEIVGVASGQLYYLIKDIKDAADTTPEDQLKKSLLDALFGEGIVMIRKHPVTYKDYYCAPVDQWERVLGQQPRVQEG